MGKLLIKRKQRVSSKRNIYFSSYSCFIALPYALEQNPISFFINLIDEIQICWRMNFLYFTASTQEFFLLVLIELRNFLYENMLAKLKIYDFLYWTIQFYTQYTITISTRKNMITLIRKLHAMPAFQIYSYTILNKQSTAILFIMSMRKKCTIARLLSDKTFFIDAGNAAQI